MRSHRDGLFESIKFAQRREHYYTGLSQILAMDYDKEDFLHYFPAFVGNLTLIRNITLYELYKKTLGISGHVAEVGVYKGAGSILFGKLIQIYEPDSLTMVHGFDHFKGTDVDTDADLQVAGGNLADEEQLRELIRLQKLDGTIKIHNMDCRTAFASFFEKHPHLRFKLIFLDSGTYKVTSEAIKYLWPRLNVGGIMVFDQYNNEVAPGETRAVNEWLSSQTVETMQPSWMPNAFVIKKANNERFWRDAD